MKLMLTFDSGILSHYFHLVNYPFSYWIFTRLKKHPPVKLFFFLKSSHFLRSNCHLFMYSRKIVPMALCN